MWKKMFTALLNAAGLSMDGKGVNYDPQPIRLKVAGNVLLGVYAIRGGSDARKEAVIPVAVATGSGAAAGWTALHGWQDYILSGRGGHLPQAPEPHWGE